MSRQITVIGAGMAGLLAAGMLRDRCQRIFEAKGKVPNNHSAVLRFRSSVVGDALNIPFRKVRAVKALVPFSNPIADAMSYSMKTNGTASLRSILSADAQEMERFIAPEDFIPRMASLSEHKIVPEPFNFRGRERPAISTIPMPALMEALDYPHRPEFRSRAGVNVTVRLPGAEAFCSLYVPEPYTPIARISLTGDLLTVECYGSDEALDGVRKEPHDIAKLAAHKLGLSGLFSMDRKEIIAHDQAYAKILPIPEEMRRAFIMWASEEHSIYSLGRFATWRPGLLLDDVVKDVRIIQNLIDGKAASYGHKIKEVN